MSFSKKRKEIEGDFSSREALENDNDDDNHDVSTSSSGLFLTEDAMKAMNRQKRPIMKHGKSSKSEQSTKIMINKVCEFVGIASHSNP